MRTRAPHPQALQRSEHAAPLRPAELAAAGHNTGRAVVLAPVVALLGPLLALGLPGLERWRPAVPLAVFVLLIAASTAASAAIGALLGPLLLVLLVWFHEPLAHAWRTTRPYSRPRLYLTQAVVVNVLCAGWFVLGGLIAPAVTPWTTPALVLVALGTQALALASFGPEPDTEQALMRALRDDAAAWATVEEQDWGLLFSGSPYGVPLTVSLDRARAPALVLIEAPVPDVEPELRLALGRGLPLHDPILDGTVAVTGVSEERARALVAGCHAEVLAVLHGNPGSTVAERRVVLRALGPDTTDPVAWLHRRLQDVSELVAVLSPTCSSGA